MMICILSSDMLPCKHYSLAASLAQASYASCCRQHCFKEEKCCRIALRQGTDLQRTSAAATVATVASSVTMISINIWITVFEVNPADAIQYGL